MQIVIKSAPLEGSVLERNDIADPQLSSFFNLNPNDVSTQEKTKMREIRAYLDSQTEDETQQWMMLKDLRYKLGTPQLGLSNVDQIHKYIRFRQAAMDNEQKAKALEQ